MAAQTRVAVMLEDPHFHVDAEVKDRIQAVADFFAKNGAKVNDRVRPAFDGAAAFQIFGDLLMAGLSRRMQLALRVTF